jgi:hypothetical protein
MTQLSNERRQRERIMLRCPVELFVPGENIARHATTVNLSSRGLYCLSDAAFSAGQGLRCRIEITPRQCQAGTDSIYLDCLVEVVRIERTPDAYGLGCRIVRYVLTRAGARDNGVSAPYARDLALQV